MIGKPMIQNIELRAEEYEADTSLCTCENALSESEHLQRCYVVIFVTASPGVATVSNNQIDERETAKPVCIPRTPALLSLLLSLVLQFCTTEYRRFAGEAERQL